MHSSHALWCVAYSGSLGVDTGRGQQQQQQQGPLSSDTVSSSRPGGSRTQRLGAKRLGSVWRHAAGEHLEQVRKALTDDLEKEESVIGTARCGNVETRLRTWNLRVLANGMWHRIVWYMFTVVCWTCFFNLEIKTGLMGFFLPNYTVSHCRSEKSLRSQWSLPHVTKSNPRCGVKSGLPLDLLLGQINSLHSFISLRSSLLILGLPRGLFFFIFSK